MERMKSPPRKTPQPPEGSSVSEPFDSSSSLSSPNKYSGAVVLEGSSNFGDFFLSGVPMSGAADDGDDPPIAGDKRCGILTW